LRDLRKFLINKTREKLFKNNYCWLKESHKKATARATKWRIKKQYFSLKKSK